MNNAGRVGESFAVHLLAKHGYSILACNYHSRFGEIDIIASKNDFIVFLEVKTRSRKGLTHPLESVTPAKQKKILLTAQHYLLNYPCDLQPRFDVIAIFTNANDKVVDFKYYKDAFQA